jgi:hypothetical protein
MGQVSASSTVLIDAPPENVLAAVADYETVRPKILSPHYSGYQVLEGGQGAGTVATWKLQATKSRVRDVKASVDVAGHTVIEKDANSSMITNWTVAPAGPDRPSRSRRRGRVQAASGASSRRRSRRSDCARSRARCWTISKQVEGR